ncbi:hypothetical protein VLK31_19760 [Variovorax sp. H27-G14]|uniref:hypothetical protein n=1 Tax=unclassified Variovorax TaxID=663243 RepID=UPI000AD2DB03|nr:hypothetical protein [Variovorax sp. PAMC 28711]
MNPHSRFRRTGALAMATLLGALAPVLAVRAQTPMQTPLQAPAQSQGRGELLYSTHCVTCHTTEMHWRDKKAATDWSSLMFQVRRWQDASGLGWNESDIQAVSRYLNERFYRYPPMVAPVARAQPVGPDGR